MNRETRIAMIFAFTLLGLSLLFSETALLRDIGIGLIGAAVVQFIRLPKDNVLPFRKRPH